MVGFYYAVRLLLHLSRFLIVVVDDVIIDVRRKGDVLVNICGIGILDVWTDGKLLVSLPLKNSMSRL